MTLTIRPATPADTAELIHLLMQDAQARCDANPSLWKLRHDAPAQIEEALTFALTAKQQPFRQFWQVAVSGTRIVGVVHAMLLPVPPIYAGSQGDPGLILPDTFVSPHAPDGTRAALLAAAENALQEAGARILLATDVSDHAWQATLEAQAYHPLTLYFSRAGFEMREPLADVRQATQADVAGIVSRSAQNRQALFAIDTFWEIHPDADARFAAWMTRSLTLQDRDMMVLGSSDNLEGYVIAQPASRLHFPPAHDIKGVGVLDDFFHPDFADPASLSGTGGGANSLVRAAESAFARRGIDASFVVCPAGWASKIEMLEAAGYQTAMTWLIKR